MANPSNVLPLLKSLEVAMADRAAQRAKALPAPQPAGKVLLERERDSGTRLRVVGYIYPRPHVRIEVQTEGKRYSVAFSISEASEVAKALLDAPRSLVAGVPWRP